MKHKSQEQIKAFRHQLTVVNVKGLLKQNKIKEAIDCACSNGIDSKEFGEISRDI